MTDHNMPEEQSGKPDADVFSFVMIPLAFLIIFICVVMGAISCNHPIERRIKIGSDVAVTEALHDRQLHTILPLPIKAMLGDGFVDVYSDPRVTTNFIVIGYAVQPCNGNCESSGNTHPKYKIDSETTFTTEFLSGYQIVGADRNESHFVVSLATDILGDMSNPHDRVLLYVSRSDMIKIIEEYRNVRASFQDHYLSAQSQEKRASDLNRQEDELKRINSDLRSVH